jgi:hypothetical protein
MTPDELPPRTTKLEVTRRAEAASYLTRHTTTPGS